MVRAPHPSDVAPEPVPARAARAGHAGLGERLRSLLARRPPDTPPEAAASRPPGSSWPDSFFDIDAAP